MHTLVPIWDGRMLFNSIDVDGNCGRHFANFSIEKVERRCPIYPGDLTAGDIVGLFWAPSAYGNSSKSAYSFGLMGAILFARRG